MSVRDTIEKIRVASFESPKATSFTQWEGRITDILEEALAEKDGEVNRLKGALIAAGVRPALVEEIVKGD